MAADEISEYVEYLKSTGQSPEDADAYGEYLRGNKTAAKEDTPSAGISALRGAGQGVTFGFSDEAIAGLRKLVNDKSYEELLKEERAKNELAKKANPLAYSGSEIAANIGTSFIPGVGLARGASALKNIGSAAAMSALSGVGNAEGDLSGRAMPGLIAGGFGGALGAAGTGVTKLMQLAAPKLAELATGATGRELLKKFKPGSGKKLLERKTVGWVTSPKNIADRAEKELVESSAGIGESLAKMRAPSKDEVIQNLLKEKAGLDDVAEKKTIQEIDKIIADIAESKNPETAQSFWNTKKKFDSQINWMNPQKDSAYLTSKAYRNTVEELAEPGSDLANKFALDRELFSTYKPIKEAAQRKAATIQQRDFGGMLDTMALLGGLSGDVYGGSKGGGTATGLSIAAARRGILPRIPSTMARTAYSPTVQNAILRAPVSTFRALIGE